MPGTYLADTTYSASVVIKMLLDKLKSTIYVENMYAKFQLHPPYGFWGEDFRIIFRKFTLYVAMATNQIQRFGQNSYES